MKKIYALVDYNGYFESKYDAKPYNSGMDKGKLKLYFSYHSFEVIFIGFPEVADYPSEFWNGQFIIYTSSEDTGFHYKGFIEDIIYYLELSNAIVIPVYRFLKANNNKVFMELLRYNLNSREISVLNSKVFGCLEEAVRNINQFNFPMIFKQSSGAMSKGVGFASTPDKLINGLERISRTPSLKKEIWENGRSLKYKNYKKQSKYRNKFIIQEFIRNCDGDFKILVFSDKYYVLKRGLKDGDFRASGSGIRYFTRDLPAGLLEFAGLVFEKLRVPNASLDIAFNGNQFFLLEFQCLFFGSFTITFSDFFWQKNAVGYKLVEGKSILEKVYCESVVNYLENSL